MRAATGRLRGFWLRAGAVRGNGLRRSRPTAQRKPGRLQHSLFRGHSEKPESARAGTRRIGRSSRHRRDLIAAGHGGYRKRCLQRGGGAHSGPSSHGGESIAGTGSGRRFITAIEVFTATEVKNET